MLRLGWRGTQPRARLLVVIGWVLLVLGMLVWSRAEGAEFGVSFSLALWSLIAWCVIAVGAKYRTAKTANKTPADSNTDDNARLLSATGTGQKWFTFIVAGPLALVTTCLVTVVLARLLPVDIGTQMVSAAFLFPVLWAVAAVYYCASDLNRRNAQILVIAGLLSGAWLFL